MSNFVKILKKHTPNWNFNRNTKYQSMKKLLMMAVGLLLAGSAAAITPDKAWNELYPQIEKSIEQPTFRAKDYKLFDYGKKSKTKGFLYTELINKVIDVCSREGGGRVIVPKGTRSEEHTSELQSQR